MRIIYLSDKKLGTRTASVCPKVNNNSILRLFYQVAQTVLNSLCHLFKIIPFGTLRNQDITISIFQYLGVQLCIKLKKS